MRLLFLRIAAMRYYKGAVRDDPPRGRDGQALDGETVIEKYNFDPVQAPNGQFCLGCFDAGEGLPLSMELFEELEPDADCAENVTVVWCAPNENGAVSVVGWYAHAAVLGYWDSLTLDTGYVQEYDILDEASSCVLLPLEEREKLCWQVPEIGPGQSFGLSRGGVWLAEGEKQPELARRIARQIEQYRGENWLRRYPEFPEE